MGEWTGAERSPRSGPGADRDDPPRVPHPSLQGAWTDAGAPRAAAPVVLGSCPECGELRLHVRDVVVRLCLDQDDTSCRYSCPDCATVIVRTPSEKALNALLSAGADVEVWHLPRELDERPDGEPLTREDLLEFHELLQHEGWFEQLCNTPPRHG